MLLAVLSATSSNLMQQVLYACFREENTDVFRSQDLLGSRGGLRTRTRPVGQLS